MRLQNPEHRLLGRLISSKSRLVLISEGAKTTASMSYCQFRRSKSTRRRPRNPRSRSSSWRSARPSTRGSSRARRSWRSFSHRTWKFKFEFWLLEILFSSIFSRGPFGPRSLCRWRWAGTPARGTLLRWLWPHCRSPSIPLVDRSSWGFRGTLSTPSDLLFSQFASSVSFLLYRRGRKNSWKRSASPGRRAPRWALGCCGHGGSSSGFQRSRSRQIWRRRSRRLRCRFLCRVLWSPPVR